jgi:translation initiation factor IF-2
MGHVDHGKTTLLDSIRKSNLTKKEIGGITQKIGAYQIIHNNQKFTFIDTPGHEAFTEMRANGSKITDIVIIVVAADDGIMPQTKEAIEHSLSANVPIIVAVNKMDSVGANYKKVVNDLMKHNIVAEELGGKIPFVKISALKGDGIKDLMDVILLQSDVLELKAPQNILASGVVIESNVDKNRGNLVSVIIKNGTLKVRDNIIIDDFIGTVKSMFDDKGKTKNEALPGEPVEIFGLGKSPRVGSKFVVVVDKESSKIADAINTLKVNKDRTKGNNLSIEDMMKKMSSKDNDFKLILKTDSQGSLSAILPKIKEITFNDVKVNIIRSDVGEVSTTEVD